MPILVSQTYDIVTPESAENGDADSRGFEFEDVPHTFRELVALMREHSEASQSPIPRDSDAVTVSFYGTPDTGTRAYFERGEEKTTAIHYSRKNLARAAKYWGMAYRAAHAKG